MGKKKQRTKQVSKGERRNVAKKTTNAARRDYIASDGMDEDRPLSLKSFNYDLHNELVDGVFQLPMTEDIDFSEKGW